MLITSNRSVRDRGAVFSDPGVATAILERLLRHSQVVTIRGDSCRSHRNPRSAPRAGRPRVGLRGQALMAARYDKHGPSSLCRKGSSSACRLTTAFPLLVSDGTTSFASQRGTCPVRRLVEGVATGFSMPDYDDTPYRCFVSGGMRADWRAS